MNVDATNPLICAAAAIAAHAHRDQQDKSGAPYTGHLSRVAAATAAASDDPVHTAIAWLHDVVEDTGHTLATVRTQIALRSPHTTSNTLQRISDALDAITHRRHEPREQYYARVAANPDALLVKEHDIADNANPVRLAALDEKDRTRLTVKYETARRHLRLSA